MPAHERKISHGTYSITGMEIRMTRNRLGLLFTSFYFPTGSFAVISSLSFLINPESVSLKMSFSSWLSLAKPPSKVRGKKNGTS